MYWTPAKMLLVADVGEHSFADADIVLYRLGTITRDRLTMRV